MYILGHVKFVSVCTDSPNTTPSKTKSIASAHFHTSSNSTPIPSDQVDSNHSSPFCSTRIDPIRPPNMIPLPSLIPTSEMRARSTINAIEAARDTIMSNNLLAMG